LPIIWDLTQIGFIKDNDKETISTMIIVNIKNQTLTFKDKVYQISTAKNGVGEVEDSFCTPRGQHKISEKIGAKASINTVFVGRKKTGEIYSQLLAKEQPNRDWILTRILWLEGCEESNKNTKQRYIYIHGAPDEAPFGSPFSSGCICMKNKDLIALFDKVSIGTEILIKEF
jgi:lipoprotein-anchoring transpeptidase ErfK/SrfK